jgi:hypothetical protein
MLSPSVCTFGCCSCLLSVLQIYTTCFSLIDHIQVCKLVLQGNCYCCGYIVVWYCAADMLVILMMDHIIYGHFVCWLNMWSHFLRYNLNTIWRIVSSGMLRRVALVSSSETSVLTRATRRNIPEDIILHSHHRENLKSYINTIRLTL